MEHGHRLSQLKWLCRRGMKELDVLFERFLASEARQLQNGQWEGLEALLAAEDDQIWDWVQNPDLPEAAPFRTLLMQIRHDSG